MRGVRSRIAALAGKVAVLIAICLMSILAVLAQSDERSRRLGGFERTLRSSEPDRIESTADFQRKFAFELDEFAVDASEGDPERYVSIVRAGLKQYSEPAGESFSRSFSRNRNEKFDLTGLAPREMVFDDRPELRRNLRRLLFDAARGARVIGGEVVERAHGFRATVGIIRAGRGICSGALIRQDVVVTAAHCVCNLGLNAPGATSKPPKVVVGEVLRQESIEPEARVYEIELEATQLFHPRSCDAAKIDELTAYIGRDVALIYLKEPVQDVAPTRFVNPQDYLSDAVSALTVVGFGRSDTQGIFTDGNQKFRATIPIISRICGFERDQIDFKCASGVEVVLMDEFFVRDTCNGDSGGPAFVYHRDQYWLAAITSRPVVPGECGPGGVYTLMSPRVVAWVETRLRLRDAKRIIDNAQR